MDLNPKLGMAAAMTAGLALGAAQANANQFADVYYYVGAAAGAATLDLSDNGFFEDSFNFDEDDTAWKIFGGVMFNDYIGVELAYLDMGKPDRDVSIGLDGGEFYSSEFNGNLEADISGFTVQLIGVLPIGQNFDLFAKGGFFFYDVDATVDGIITDGFGIEPIREKASDSGTKGAFGIGARYYFGNFGVRAEYEAFDIDAGDLTQWTLGVQYRF